MAVEPLITQADLELRIGATRLVQLLDLNGDGAADSAVIAKVIAQGSHRAAGKLLRAFSIDQIQRLAAEDPGFRSAIEDICLGYVGEVRTEFTDAQGRTLYADMQKRGLATLDDYIKGADRIAAEETVGANPMFGHRTSRRGPVRFIFAASKDDPKGPGGF